MKSLIEESPPIWPSTVQRIFLIALLGIMLLWHLQHEATHRRLLEENESLRAQVLESGERGQRLEAEVESLKRFLEVLKAVEIQAD